ncbi:MAG: (2Fe-2S)-binding protein [Bdellovibrionales bacterium]|jgi:aerobic-type carbon monoxide dehydrogenase small subunit (CoxS/CutS family)|nr:(2Fe-2S)-binding protein [Bdellovibrionales bacterium]MBT3526803.1 (2Fe-2S)-binding protein [Bdellovibrionales bacterium]MBT7766294.1 (2Fe-2S)-binding protein [Bdellovibrionales bacterium]
MKVSFTLNSETRWLECQPNQTLLHALREQLGVKSPKCGCERGDCGTCTILLDGKSIKSCLVLACEVEGCEITTLEGLMQSGLTPLQKAFLDQNAFQCGFCAPGMVIAATELLEHNSSPNRGEIEEALAGNLCRCTGYAPIIDAVLDLVDNGGK